MNKDKDNRTVEDFLDQHEVIEINDITYIRKDKVKQMLIDFSTLQSNQERECVNVEKIKYTGLWTPRYLADKILFPTPINIQACETMLNSWAHDIVGENNPKWIDIKDEKPEIGVIVNVVLKHSKLDVYSGFRAKGGWYCFRIGEDSKQFIPNGFTEVKIIKWQELPKPPIS